MSGGLGLFLKGNGDGTFTEIEPEDSGIWIHEDAKSLAKGDLNGDGAPDLVCATNNGPLKTLVNQTRGPEARWTTIALEAGKGNPTAVGSRVEIETNTGAKITKEVAAGGSYLSQSTATLFVALGREEWITTVKVRWPRGDSSESSFEMFQSRVMLRRPETR